MSVSFKIISSSSPSGCHAFPKGSELEFSLFVSDTAIEKGWFYIGNDERVLMEREVYPRGNSLGSVLQLTLKTSDICDSDGLLFCHFEFISNGIRYYSAHEGYSCRLSDRFVNEAQLLIYNEKYLAPEWLIGGVIYQIFPDRFARGGEVVRRSDAVYDEEWDNGIPEYPAVVGEAFPNNKHFGGSLYGIVERLDYLVSLGVNCIYLNPIFDAFSTHKYDTANFMKVDSTFGGDEALKCLIDKAHEKGIAVVLDGVFNHVGDDSIYFDAYKRYGNGACSSNSSPYREWFNFIEYPDKYDSWWGMRNLPKINRCESYISYITNEVIPKYMKMGIDGWRLDVVDELEGEVLERITEAVKAIKPDAVIIGEVWEDASNKIAYDQRKCYFRGCQLDSVTDYPIRNAIIEFVKYGNADFLVDTVRTLYRNYPPKKLAAVMNFLGSHDTERIATVLCGEPDCGEDNSVLAVKKMPPEARERAKKLLAEAYALLASLPGVPCIFYGDEIAIEGYHDPFNRRPFPVSGFEDEYSRFFAKVNKLRADEPAFKAESLIAESPIQGVVKIVRFDPESDSNLLIISNMSDREYKSRLKYDSVDLITGERFADSVLVPPHKTFIFKQTRK